MADNEEEQLEALKDWWNEHGKSTLAAIVLAVGGVLGYQAWQNNAQETGEAASLLYKDLLEASASLAEETPDEAEDSDGEADESEESPMMATARNLAETLKTDYTHSTYARFAALHLAKLAVADGDLEAAASELEWALEEGVDAGLEVIVRLRLARVLLAQGNADESLAALDSTLPSSAQRASFEEVRGDIYHARGDYQQAREAYQLALESLGEEENRPMLKAKLAAIPVATGIAAADDVEEKSEGDVEEKPIEAKPEPNEAARSPDSGDDP